MLVSFAASNHRSLRERTSISFVAEGNPTTDERATLVVPGFDLAVVPVLGLFGPNGSGKSNLLSALAALTYAVTNSQNRWDPDDPPHRDPFMGTDGPSDAPSTYELTFVFDEAVYEYSVALGSRHIEDERLLVASNGPRSWAELFHRTAGSDGQPEVKVGRKLKGPRAAAQAATRPNSLFLSAAAQSNHETLLPVWRWIRDSYPFANVGNRHSRARYTANILADNDGDDELKERIRAFVAAADLGIADLSAVRESIPEEDRSMLRRLFSVMDREAPGDDELTTIRTTLQHRGDVGRLPLEEESAGTKAWFEWAAPVLDALDLAQALSADELDSYLNSHLVAQIVGSFQDPKTNRLGAQLLFTGQNPATMTLAGLARDQIAIVEKNALGVSEVIPVTDYSVRRDWDVGAAYSHGRFGGLPVVDENALALALRGDQPG